MIEAFGFGKAIEAAEQPAQGVAQPAVEFGLLLEDLGADAEVFGNVGVHHPKAQDVGTKLVRHLLRGGDVTERLAHLVAALVQHEAMGQQSLEGRAAAGADGLEQAGLEPAAVLVAAFEVEVGGPWLAAALEGEAVGAAAFEPDVDDVHHLLVFGRVALVAEEAGGGTGLVPGVGTLFGEGGIDAGHDGGVAERLAGAAVDEHGNGNTPGALPADAPVGTAGDHGRQAVPPGLGHEAGFRNGVQGAGADLLGPIHADEHCGVAR